MEHYPQTYIPALREDLDSLDDSMKVRIQILTCFLWKLLVNKDLMDAQTKMPVTQIWEFFENATDVSSESLQYAHEGFMSGAKAKINSWFSLGAAQTNRFTSSTNTSASKYKTELDEFRTNYGVLTEQIKELKELAERLGKPLPELIQSVPTERTGISLKLAQLSDLSGSRDTKLRKRIFDCILQPLQVGSDRDPGALK